MRITGVLRDCLCGLAGRRFSQNEIYWQAFVRYVWGGIGGRLLANKCGNG